MTSLAEATARTLRCIETLDVDFQKRVRGWLVEMQNSRIIPLIYCGRRTMEEQAMLFAQGRSRPGKIITQAKPGTSYHNYGLAFDWCPMRTAKGDLLDTNWNDETAFRLGEHVGLTFNLAAISWETGHLQDGRYASWRDIPNSPVEPVEQKKPAKKSLVSKRPWSSR
jgi:D-alanyl-D-alanine carboxypeptidase